jgi:hypothetical protein
MASAPEAERLGPAHSSAAADEGVDEARHLFASQARREQMRRFAAYVLLVPKEPDQAA